MAQSLKDWLGILVEAELNAVIQWKCRIKPEPGTEDDLEDRFGDDGSNLQSAVSPARLTAENRVQIIKVLAVGDVPTVLVSDGFTSIKATVSEAALAALEAELDEELSLDMKGDVIRPRDMAVISTPYGPADGFVQLHIDALEYQFSLRKTPKDHIPIQQRDSIVKLLDEITKIRHQPLVSQENDAIDDVARLSAGQVSPESEPGASQVSLDAATTTHQSHQKPSPIQPGPASQRPVEVGDTASQYSAAIATQVVPRKRRRGPTLETDGFETQTGANLARPNSAIYGTTPTSHQPRGTQHPATVSTDTLRLLNLLGERKAQSPPRKIAKPASLAKPVFPAKAVVPARPEPIVIEDDESSPMDIEPSSISLTKVSAESQGPLNMPLQNCESSASTLAVSQFRIVVLNSRSSASHTKSNNTTSLRTPKAARESAEASRLTRFLVPFIAWSDIPITKCTNPVA